MKRALILAAIHPGLGGVLIQGSKGAAKSTAVRALASLLPDIEVCPGDPFRRARGEDVPGWPLPEGAGFEPHPVALVNFPVGATDDRVTGSLNLERALATGSRAFEPGLLATAHRGILYIDEVNLLGDHLVDLLLDAAAMGVNHVEREGVTFRHPSRFVLVGTMNPEEGELRPQLLDRFGLAVEVEPMNDPRARAEVVRRRLAFETDPDGFRQRWAEADRREGERIVAAQQLLPSVVVPERVLDSLCARCAREGADGLRADLTIYKAATALAAYEGRTTVTLDDVDAVAELALAHRRTKPRQPSPPPPPPNGQGEPDNRDGRASSAPRTDAGGRSSDSSLRAESSGPPAGDDVQPQWIAASEPRALPSDAFRPAGPPIGQAPGRRGRASVPDRRGVFVRTSIPRGRATDPAVGATLRAAAPLQALRGRIAPGPMIVRPSDVRDKVRLRPARRLVLFVVDASRSMGARRRMAETKAAVLSLLVHAYQKRDKVGLITFGGTSARLALPPTRSVRTAASHLNALPVGGATPLGHGLELAGRIIDATRKREPGVASWVVLLTDGRANVPLRPEGCAETESLGLARRLGQAGVLGLVIDTEAGPVRLGLAGRLAEAWGVDVLALDDMGDRRLPEAVRRALLAG
ncbi:MAG: VWA domain-containing protein [Isosphaeraceae bacterium]|nr:VWA domain-containing protein [Isosphaeraceae bacterium]